MADKSKLSKAGTTLLKNGTEHWRTSYDNNHLQFANKKIS